MQSDELERLIRMQKMPRRILRAKAYRVWNFLEFQELNMNGSRELRYGQPFAVLGAIATSDLCKGPILVQGLDGVHLEWIQKILSRFCDSILSFLWGPCSCAH